MSLSHAEYSDIGRKTGILYLLLIRTCLFGGWFDLSNLSEIPQL